jgi:hypothetical protein
MLKRTRDDRRLLDRILDTPNLGLVVPRLPPGVLHRVIQTCGLEDCGELVALATPDQLARVLDLDLWRTARPGVDEQLDADRFGVWLEVLLECGAAVAAQKLADMDVDLVIAALAQHMLVFDLAAVARSAPSDCDIGGYRVVATRTGWWDAIAAVLILLEAERPDYFHRVMRGCRSLSNSTPEVDGLHDLLTDRKQTMFNLALDRERRREKSGYVTPAQARGFLQMSRELQLGHDTTPPDHPIVRAYFREIEPPTVTDDDSAAATAAVIDVLLEEGVIAPQPRALLDGPQGPAPRLARMHAHLQLALERDAAAYAMRTEELAYLANTLMAGCSIQARPFTEREASDAAVAVCNLGLENWPPHWPPANDLVSAFQVGWSVLHHDVSMYAAEQLVGVLTNLQCADREIQTGINALRIELARKCRAGTPWHARDALDVIVSLDMPAWAALLGLIDECPVLHGAIGASRDSRTRAVSASAFELISDNSQIASVRAFMESLPDTLRG